ncbi:MAG: hypothetical protein LUH04_09605, partial [Clostridium sp.]|nr:hypothetical protein [Clostridium sp.]
MIKPGRAGVQRSRNTEKGFLRQQPGHVFKAKLLAVRFRFAQKGLPCDAVQPLGAVLQHGSDILSHFFILEV